MIDTAATKYKDYMTNLQGKQYMTVQGRVKWFRDEHKNGCIDTDFKQVGTYTIASCKVSVDNVMIASGSATVRAWKKGNDPRDIEKAETAAIGRALANAGYGTQFSGDELDDTDYLSDSPIATSSSPSPQPTPQPKADVSDRKKIAMARGSKLIHKIEKVQGLNVRQQPQWKAYTKIDDTDYTFILWADRLRMIEQELMLDENALDIKTSLEFPPHKQIAVYTQWDDKYQAVMGNDLSSFESSFSNPAMRTRFMDIFKGLRETELAKALGKKSLSEYEGSLRYAVETVQDWIDGQAEADAQAQPETDEPKNIIKPTVYGKQKALAGMPAVEHLG